MDQSQLAYSASVGRKQLLILVVPISFLAMRLRHPIYSFYLLSFIIVFYVTLKKRELEFFLFSQIFITENNFAPDINRLPIETISVVWYAFHFNKAMEFQSKRSFLAFGMRRGTMYV